VPRESQIRDRCPQTRLTTAAENRADAVVDICEHRADVPALGPIADLRERCQRRRVRLGRFGREKRLDADPRRLRERHGSLDAVAQFSHVAGPGMIEQGLLSAR